MSLLDVGCGPGTITADLAGRVDPGPVLGLDREASVIDEARRAFADVANLRFEVGDVYGLAAADATYDVVYAHQVLQHLSAPIAALAEMRRVLVPGGLLAVRDADYGAFVWAPDDPVLDRWRELYHDLTRRNGAQADAGRYLKTWVRAAGFRDVEVSSSTWTFSTAEERRWWGGLWADRVRQSAFAEQCASYGLATARELQAVAEAFDRWSQDDDGVFLVVHGEVLARA